MTSAPQMIPLNKLIASPRNVRRTDRKADIDALAASIASRGLLQNLCVVENDDGKFEVDAGGRRLAALKQLARDKVIPKDHPVACNVFKPKEGKEVSLTENVHRIAMDAIDEAEAYAALVEEGMNPDDVARRFGATRRHVDQRLALSGLSPRIKAAWKRGDVSLEAARAFCLVTDHAQQDAVFKSLGKPVTHAPSVRARLMEGRIRTCDRLVKFVGLEAYELAGGVVTRDLFDTEAVYIADPALVARMAEEKLQAGRQTWLDQGWGWVDVHLAQSRPDGYAPSRVQPVSRDATEEEQAEIQRLECEINALDEALDQDSVEDDARWETRDTLAGQVEAIRQAMRVWPAALIGLAGVALSIDHDGNARATCGLIRGEDEKAVRAVMLKANKGQSADTSCADARIVESRDIDLPKTIIRELSQARTRAIRSKLVQRPQTALAVTVAAIALRMELKCELHGVAISGQAPYFDDDEAFAAVRADLVAILPRDEEQVLAWCLSQPAERLLQLLAIFASLSIDLSHEKGAPGDTARRANADCLAKALDIDMRRHWNADGAYWCRLSKAQLIAALETSPTFEDMPGPARVQAMKAYGKLKQDELAAKVEEAFSGAGYLPEMLVTPIEPGILQLTDAGLAAIAAE